jgi:hypothetical protein
MKIPIRVEFFAGGLRPMATFTLRSDSPPIFGFVNAIIDTGSPTTILGGADVQRMRISQVQMRKLIGEEKEVNLGGAQIKTRILPDAQLSIGNNVRIKIPVQVPVKIVDGVPPPTIIGVDFLEKGRLKFFFDPAGRESYFEIPD